MLPKLATSLLLLPLVLGASLESRRQTPNFYLYSVSQDANYHLQPVRDNQYTASLGGVGAPQKFYLDSGSLLIDNPGNPNGPHFSVINSLQGPDGCATGGNMHLLPTWGSNKCARSSTFTLSSYNQNSQLGAKLLFTSTLATSFYVCAGGYLTASATPVAGCTPVELWTNPAIY